MFTQSVEGMHMIVAAFWIVGLLLILAGFAAGLSDMAAATSAPQQAAAAAIAAVRIIAPYCICQAVERIATAIVGRRR